MTPVKDINLKLPEGVMDPRPRGLSVIIPSKTFSNALPCVEAVRKHEPGGRIIVVDDGLSMEPTEENFADVVRWQKSLAYRIDGRKPFVFARNCNLGIAAAGNTDIVILNDDALLESAGGFTLMQETAEANPKLALISASTNFAGNPEQHRRRDAGFRILTRNTPGNSFPTVAFVCVLIPRRTIQAIGMLDERFTKYGFEDNDYCRRIQMVGKQIAVHDGCFVDHSQLKSSYRGAPATAGKLQDGREIYMNKWGSM